MKTLIRRAFMTFGACAVIFAATSCNPNRNNPNYNASRTQQQPGTTQSPGVSGNTGSVSGAGDASNTGSSSSSGSSSGS